MSWAELEERREDLLHALAPPILSALGNDDTPSPIFHGCYDWHSAVHGIYSLYAIHGARATTSISRPRANTCDRSSWPPSSSTCAATSWSVRRIRTGSPGSSRARAEELAAGTLELRPLADHAAARVSAMVTALDPDAARALATHDKHPNLSWALLHLALWARHTEDPQLLRLACEATRTHLLDPELDEVLPSAADTGPVSEFMPPSLMRLAAVSAALGAEGREEVDRRIPDGFRVPPLTEPQTAHAGGVNFFRAFALLHLHRATGRDELRESGAELTLYQCDRTDLWRSGGYDHRHWIAQIGVRVIDDSYDD